MRIAILGAMNEEIAPLLKKFEHYESISYANNTYYITKYNDIDLIIAYSKIGKVNSALTATILIEKFKAQKLIFTGVAGAINEELKIGDLLVATSLVQHDVDISAFGHPFGFIPESKLSILPDKNLQELAKNVAKELSVDLKFGAIATGDQFIYSCEKKEWIKKVFNASAVEMEGASVAFVCDAFNIPFLVLRAISDASDVDAGFNFDEFLQSSANISADFVISMLDKIK